MTVVYSIADDNPVAPVRSTPDPARGHEGQQPVRSDAGQEDAAVRIEDDGPKAADVRLERRSARPLAQADGVLEIIALGGWELIAASKCSTLQRSHVSHDRIGSLRRRGAVAAVGYELAKERDASFARVQAEPCNLDESRAGSTASASSGTAVSSLRPPAGS